MNKTKLLGIYGASGFGREVMPIANMLYKQEYDLVFIDDTPITETLNGYPIITLEKFLELPHHEKYVSIAIANSNIREKLANRIQENNINTLDIIAPNNMILENNSIGEGLILCPFTTITSNSTIGKFFHANIYSYVAHDCIIGDYVTFAPSVKCNGNVHIEDHVYIGTGAMIKQGTPDKPITIGKGAVIGMGSVVTKSVKAGDVVFGVPAKSIKRGGN